MLHSGGQYQGWPTSGRIGYITPAISGVPNPSQRGTIPTMAHKWADGLHNPAIRGVPKASQRGNNINNGPQVGGLAT